MYDGIGSRAVSAHSKDSTLAHLVHNTLCTDSAGSQFSTLCIVQRFCTQIQYRDDDGTCSPYIHRSTVSATHSADNRDNRVDTWGNSVVQAESTDSKSFMVSHLPSVCLSNAICCSRLIASACTTLLASSRFQARLAAWLSFYLVDLARRRGGETDEANSASRRMSGVQCLRHYFQRYDPAGDGALFGRQRLGDVSLRWCACIPPSPRRRPIHRSTPPPGILVTILCRPYLREFLRLLWTNNQL